MRDISDSQTVEMLLRALYEGTTTDPPWVRNWDAAGEMEVLAHDTDQVRPVPYQYLLISLASDRTRAVTRDTAEAVRDAANLLLALLDRFDRARAADGEHLAKLLALLESPFQVKLPHGWETRDADALAVIVRDAGFGGSWDKTIRWLSPPRAEWRPIDAARAHRLRAFEETYRVDLADLLFSESARAELEAARRRSASEMDTSEAAVPPGVPWLHQIARG